MPTPILPDRCPPPPTHYIPWDDPWDGTVGRTLCHQFIDRRDHDNEPTCPECRWQLEEFERQELA